ncbi:MAG: HlyU family transcriptional regulator [Psychromonas sp.]
MGFFKKISQLFATTEKAKTKHESVEHKGYLITPQPESDKGQFRLAALIEKKFSEEEAAKQYYLIRSDTFASAEQAAEFAVSKSKLFIDQTGDAMFK